MKRLWQVVERTDGSIEIQEAGSERVICVMALYPDGSHKESASDIAREHNATIPFRNMYQTALELQSACNLSGLCMAMPRITHAVWEELRAQNNGTTVAFQNHPVMRLLVEQISFLTHATDWSKAYHACEEKAKVTNVPAKD